MELEIRRSILSEVLIGVEYIYMHVFIGGEYGVMSVCIHAVVKKHPITKAWGKNCRKIEKHLQSSFVF